MICDFYSENGSDVTGKPVMSGLGPYALINKAHGLDNTIVSDANFTDWQNILLGLNNVLTCTAVLAGKINAVTQGFSIRGQIMPPQWS